VQYSELGDQTVAEEVTEEVVEQEEIDEELVAKLNTPLSELELSVRANNCLESVKMETVGELVKMTEAELLKIRSFGRTSLREVKRKLADMGLSLGMTPGE
jgi:DNA-directed RNA polymerase subunit alpha